MSERQLDAVERHRRLEESIPEAVRWAVLERDGFQCQFCGTAGDNRLQLHHWRDWRSGGGGHEVSNLVTLCAWDHERVHARLQDIELREIGPEQWTSFRWTQGRRRR
jgi:5-methylcytosine-specific restriction endonuclease McrA